MRSKTVLFITLIFATILLSLTAVVRAQESLPGDPIKGGLLYDAWFNTLGIAPPRGDHPLWETRLGTSTRSGSATWRCQTCHGWDYKGSDGAYGPGTPEYTGFPGVMGAVGASNQDIMDWLNGAQNIDHDFSPYMDQEELQHLVAFLRTKQIDIALLVDYETKMALGDTESGQGLYDATCSSCHGEDGSALNFAFAYNPTFVGDVASEDPWRTVHKIRFGHPATEMPSAESLGWTLQQVADVLAYSQTLPMGSPTIPEQPTVETEILTTEGQGDPIPIIFGAILIVIIIYAALAWGTRRNPQ